MSGLGARRRGSEYILGDETHHAGEGCYGVAGDLLFKLAAWGARWAWCQRRKTLGNVGSFTL